MSQHSILKSDWKYSRIQRLPPSSCVLKAMIELIRRILGWKSTYSAPPHLPATLSTNVQLMHFGAAFMHDSAPPSVAAVFLWKVQFSIKGVDTSSLPPGYGKSTKQRIAPPPPAVLWVKMQFRMVGETALSHRMAPPWSRSPVVPYRLDNGACRAFVP